jgi:hypothetical protein
MNLTDCRVSGRKSYSRNGTHELFISEEKHMTSRERVLAALKLKQPDRVPWVESSVHNKLA